MSSSSVTKDGPSLVEEGQNALMMLLFILAAVFWLIQREKNNTLLKEIQLLEQKAQMNGTKKNQEQQHARLIKKIETLENRVQINHKEHRNDLKVVVQRAVEKSKREHEKEIKELESKWEQERQEAQEQHRIKEKELQEKLSLVKEEAERKLQKREKELIEKHERREKELLQKLARFEHEEALRMKRIEEKSEEFQTPVSSREFSVSSSLVMFDALSSPQLEKNAMNVESNAIAACQQNGHGNVTADSRRNVTELRNNDVVYDSGKKELLSKAGSKRFRKLCQTSALNYANSEKLAKPLVALEVVQQWRRQDPEGRFLELDKSVNKWNDVGDKRALDITSRLLRDMSSANGNGKKQRDETKPIMARDERWTTKSGDAIEEDKPTLRKVSYMDADQSRSGTIGLSSRNGTLENSKSEKMSTVVERAAKKTSKSKSSKKKSPIIHCHATEEPCPTITQVLKRLKDTSVTKLSCQETVTDDDVVAICGVLRVKTCSLVSLSLRRNNLTATAAQAVGGLLEVNESILELDLASNNIGSNGILALTEPLALHNKTLVRLVLEDNNLSAKCATSIGRLLRHNTTLKELRLGGSSLVGSYHFGHHGIKVIAPDLQHNSSLETLALNHNKLGTKGALLLATKVLNKDNAISSLDLSCNRIGHKGTEALSQVLLDDKVIRSLSLKSNDLESAGAHSLVCVLRFNSTLTLLKLGNNKIGDDGAVALAGGLESNSSLESIYLDWNGIGNRGTEAISSSLRQNSALKFLDLSANQIGPAGADKLADALHYNLTLKELNVERNQIGDDGVRALGGLVTSCRDSVFQSLHWKDNNLSDGCFEWMSLNVVQNDNSNGIEEVETESTPVEGNINGIEEVEAETMPPLESISPSSSVTSTACPLPIQPKATATFPESETNQPIWLKAMLKDLKENRTACVDLTKKSGVNNDVFVELMSVLSANKSTRTLYLGANVNNVMATGIRSLASALEENSCLERLYICDCQNVGDKGLAMIAEALKKNKCLKTLSVVSCGVTAASMGVVAGMLRQNKTLQRLHLSKNSIGDAGMKLLGGCLEKQNSTLKSLAVAYNGITDQGLTHIMRASQVTELRLDGNEITDEGARQWSNAASGKGPCQYGFVGLAGNKISAEGKNALRWCLPDSAKLMI